MRAFAIVAFLGLAASVSVESGARARVLPNSGASAHWPPPPSFPLLPSLGAPRWPRGSHFLGCCTLVRQWGRVRVGPGGGGGLLFRAPRNVARETQRAPAVGEVGWGLAPQLPLLCTPCIEARRLGWAAGGERARGAGGWAANTPPCADASAGEHLLSRPPLPPHPRPIPRVALQTGRQHSHLEDREASCVVS